MLICGVTTCANIVSNAAVRKKQKLCTISESENSVKTNMVVEKYLSVSFNIKCIFSLEFVFSSKSVMIRWGSI